MDRLFSFTAGSSEMSQDFFPPIQLDTNYSYSLGLFSLNTYNSIPNIVNNVNNKFCYKQTPDAPQPICISLPEGSYELEEIEIHIFRELKKRHGNDVKFTLKPNTVTLKVELFCSFIVLNNSKDSIMHLLGFSKSEFQNNTSHSSDLFVQITSVNEINIECNIVEGSFRNGQPCHTLFSFYPDVPPGYKISILPTNILYLPINTRTINNITLRLTDQKGNLINFRGEEITIQLNLRKIWD